MQLTGKTLLWAQPEPGAIAYDYCQYRHATGLELVRTRCTERIDDIVDVATKCFSLDNGRSWSDWQPIVTERRLQNGLLRTMEASLSHDPITGRSIEMILEGLFPHSREDDALAGMSQFYNKYRVYEADSRAPFVEELVVQLGYTKEHPLEKVWVGKNAMDAMAPLATSRGHILLPLQITIVGPDGEIVNPGGGYTWHEIQMLTGEWQADGRIAWEGGANIRLGPDVSTRGAIEPTLAEFPDGRILMVFRASNGWSKDPQCKMPSYKWYCISEDGGASWTSPSPWTYSDGTPFFSPSSNPQLTKHLDGRVYWHGHINAENSKANNPRYPLIIGEVDQNSLLLKRDSVITVDTRRPEESETIAMHRVGQRIDRETGEIVLSMSRLDTNTPGAYTGDAWEYRIEP